MARDVYVFAREALPELLQNVQGLGPSPARFVAHVTGGPYQAVAVVEREEERGIYWTLRDVFGNPDVGKLETATPARIGPSQIRYTEHWPSMAWIRIHAEVGKADSVLEQVGAIHGHNGSAIVFGAFDILVEFGADSDEGLGEIVLDRLHAVDGIVRTQTLLIDGFYYRGRPEAYRGRPEA